MILKGESQKEDIVERNIDSRQEGNSMTRINIPIVEDEEWDI